MRISDWSSDVCSSDLAKSLRRPNFGALNPAVTLNHSNNPLVQSGGSAGNPDLKVQKSQSYDATFEYYFPSGYVAVAGYYRDISDRVITSAVVEMYDGDPYAVSRPRNIGQATLKGVELSSQHFFEIGSASCRERGGQYV